MTFRIEEVRYQKIDRDGRRVWHWRFKGVYYSGKTFTVETPHALPPHSRLERPLDLYEFRRHLPGADRPTLTYAAATRNAINFGLAARYTRNSITATVYREEHYPELVLANQAH